MSKGIYKRTPEMKTGKYIRKLELHESRCRIIQKGNETKRKNGIPFNTTESALKAWETRRKNDPNNESMKGVGKKSTETKRKNGINLLEVAQKTIKTRKHNYPDNEWYIKTIDTKIKNGTLFSSKPCTKILDSLEEYLGIKIRREFPIHDNKCGLKFYDGQWKRMLIEVDGSYWHSKPEQKINDMFKDYIASKHGYRLYRIAV